MKWIPNRQTEGIECTNKVLRSETSIEFNVAAAVAATVPTYVEWQTNERYSAFFGKLNEIKKIKKKQQ